MCSSSLNHRLGPVAGSTLCLSVCQSLPLGFLTKILCKKNLKDGGKRQISSQLFSHVSIVDPLICQTEISQQYSLSSGTPLRPNFVPL